MAKRPKNSAPSLPHLPCGCATLRRATRAVTQLYDEALRPLDLRVTQFTILQVLERAGRVTQGDIGRALVMDSTTLSRTLKLMEKGGWIESVPGEDRRERYFGLTAKGRRLLQRAQPHWESAQRRLQKLIGQRDWADMFDMMNRMAGTVSRP